MSEFLSVLASPWSFVLVLVVFGIAPGLLTRLITLMYPKGHPRRAELVAEIYAVPRMKRPMWVAEQLELGLSEGLGERLRGVRARRAARRRVTQDPQAVRQMRATIRAAQATGVLGAITGSIGFFVGLPKNLDLSPTLVYGLGTAFGISTTVLATLLGKRLLWMVEARVRREAE